MVRWLLLLFCIICISAPSTPLPGAEEGGSEDGGAFFEDSGDEEDSGFGFDDQAFDEQVDAAPAASEDEPGTTWSDAQIAAMDAIEERIQQRKGFDLDLDAKPTDGTPFTDDRFWYVTQGRWTVIGNVSPRFTAELAWWLHAYHREPAGPRRFTVLVCENRSFVETIEPDALADAGRVAPLGTDGRAWVTWLTDPEERDLTNFPRTILDRIGAEAASSAR